MTSENPVVHQHKSHAGREDLTGEHRMEDRIQLILLIIIFNGLGARFIYSGILHIPGRAHTPVDKNAGRDHPDGFCRLPVTVRHVGRIREAPGNPARDHRGCILSGPSSHLPGGDTCLHRDDLHDPLPGICSLARGDHCLLPLYFPV